MRINLVVVWWKERWGLQGPHFTTAAKSLFLHPARLLLAWANLSLTFLLCRNIWLPANMHPQEAWSNTWIPSSPKSHMELPHLRCILPSLCLLASRATQGKNSATDVTFHLQHSYSSHEWLFGAPLKETSQGWNCAKTHKGRLLLYYFYSIRFLATIACFWERIKRQSGTLLLTFCIFYFLKKHYFIFLRGTEDSSPSCNIVFVSFILQGSDRDLLHLLLFFVFHGGARSLAGFIVALFFLLTFSGETSGEKAMKMCESRNTMKGKGGGFIMTHEDSFPMGK